MDRKSPGKESGRGLYDRVTSLQSQFMASVHRERTRLIATTDGFHFKKTGAQDTCMLLGCNKANLLLRWSDRIQSGMTNEKTHLTKHLLKNMPKYKFGTTNCPC